VYVSQRVTHRHPAFWDARERFFPERFTREREAARHRHGYFPFGQGREPASDSTSRSSRE
jgi:cytochrome P450